MERWRASALVERGGSDRRSVCTLRATTAVSLPATLIGMDWGLWTEANLTAPFGTLVGRIGGGDFFKIGTSFTQTATSLRCPRAVLLGL